MKMMPAFLFYFFLLSFLVLCVQRLSHVRCRWYVSFLLLLVLFVFPHPFPHVSARVAQLQLRRAACSGSALELRGIHDREARHLVADGLVEHGGEVALAEGGDDRDDGLAGHLGALSELQRRVDVGAAREAAEDAVRAGQLLRGVYRVVALHGDDLVHDLAVEHGGHEAGADALDLVGPRLAAGEHRRLRRLHRDAEHRRLLLLQVVRNAGERAARADAGHDGVHLALRLTPDLGAGRLLVDEGIVLGAELIRQDRVRVCGHDLVRHGDGALHAEGRGGEDELRAEDAQQAAALQRHGLRHRDDDAVAAHDAELRQGHTGVAARRLDDDGLAGDQLAVLLGLVVDGEAKAVLHGSHRVLALELEHNLGLGVVELAEVQARGVADELVEVLGHLIGAVKGGHGGDEQWWGGKMKQKRANE
ncbi:transcriptional regulator [Strigomonas culicis]|uniref:Transcriptional regulator n=1 Tax=Strigomonas culicis TaxID=28005 RepID=S9WCB7_9TRYP|nr:transcriptional regulator [Strigomonas culicis]|eukprot:EPY36761.1 transcriptional regulator [Strigomonas culicis]